MNKLIGLLRLTRPANIITAMSDIMAGVAIAAFYNSRLEPTSLFWLILATVGLYGGGVVFNDVFDAELDRVERPERAIPSGLIMVKEAVLLGSILLIVGVSAASFVSLFPSGAIALAIAIAAIVYDKWGKHHALIGPLNMGLCRGLNLLLGMSILGYSVFQFSYLAVVPIIYISAITMISRGEVHGGKSYTMAFALLLYVVVMGCILFNSYKNDSLIYCVFFIVAFAGMTWPPLLKAMRDPKGKYIGRAVKAGVLGLILMNAAWASAFGAIFSAVIILLLLPVSILLARLFAVT